jgi:hypothetical protein
VLARRSVGHSSAYGAKFAGCSDKGGGGGLAVCRICAGDRIRGEGIDGRRMSLSMISLPPGPVRGDSAISDSSSCDGDGKVGA